MGNQQVTGEKLTRRTFLTTAAAGSLATVGSQTGSAQAETFQFGGEVQAWQGRAPESISGQSNPTMQLTAGQEYQVVWENLDGQPHNFALQDAEGNNIVSSNIISEQGATQTVTFTASEAMEQYICEVHPTTMVGDVEVTGGESGGPTGLQIPTGAYAIAVALGLAFLSPLVFAFFLFSRGGREREAEQVVR
ncbi:cupredoxin domain-containing protein [Halorussus halophilus]|uniref:cupredoxin domain-containing protein n=1 Tax=Halorussus halophilus TaxID=2650975 RepID=UPI001300FC2B|nr:plastocyanin/azurin family copper-binding protein [Halorussus halophilus]